MEPLEIYRKALCVRLCCFSNCTECLARKLLIPKGNSRMDISETLIALHTQDRGQRQAKKNRKQQKQKTKANNKQTNKQTKKPKKTQNTK